MRAIGLKGIDGPRSTTMTVRASHGARRLPIPLAEDWTLTEWTLDLMVPTDEDAGSDDAAAKVAPLLQSATHDGSLYRELVAWTPMEDLQLDVVEWFP